jgi:hypothetical protein
MGDRGYWQDREHIWSPPTRNVSTLTPEQKYQTGSYKNTTHGRKTACTPQEVVCSGEEVASRIPLSPRLL